MKGIGVGSEDIDEAFLAKCGLDPADKERVITTLDQYPPPGPDSAKSFETRRADRRTRTRQEHDGNEHLHAQDVI